MAFSMKDFVVNFLFILLGISYNLVSLCIHIDVLIIIFNFLE